MNINQRAIGTARSLLLLALLFPLGLYAEVRTIQEYDSAGRTWNETLETTTEPKGGQIVKIQGPALTQLSHFDATGKLKSLTLSGGQDAFQAQRVGNKVAVTAGNRSLTVDLGSRDWIGSPEQAAKVLLASGQNKAEFVYIPPNQPELNLVLEIVKRGTVERKAATVVEFAIAATGLMGLFVPPMTVWLSPDGRLVAQQVLPSPPPPNSSGEEKTKPQGGLKTVLQEVIGSRS
jgi:hypothetical protein